MATAPLGADSALVTHPRAIPPAPAVMAILSRFDRTQLHGFIAVAIELADTLDSDPDLEEDDPQGACDEDEISTNLSAAMSGTAGCEIGDPDCAVDDSNCDDPHQDLEPSESDHAHPDYGPDQDKGPLPPHLADDRSLRRPFVERARRKSARKLDRPDIYGRTHKLVEA